MLPVGYMAKRISQRPEWLKASVAVDVYSVSSCVNDDFADYVGYWKHNGWWFFDSPEAIQAVSREHSIDLGGALLFYYEVYELEFFEGEWCSFSPWEDRWKDSEEIVLPANKRIDGYDVVTFWTKNSPAPEHSPLSCNSLAENLKTNAHCLFDTFEQARIAVNTGQFTGCEPGALRIFGVFSADWPVVST
jgi:hypothetical protein